MSESRLLASLHEDAQMGCPSTPSEAQVRLEIPNERVRERERERERELERELTVSSFFVLLHLCFYNALRWRKLNDTELAHTMMICVVAIEQSSHL